MTQLQLQNEIESKLLIKEIKLDEEYLPHVASLTFKSNYIQLLYDYDIDVLLTVLEVLEHNEVYEQCAVITQTIKNHNKLEGTTFTTTYKNHE